MFVDLLQDVPDAKPVIVLTQSQHIQQSTKSRQRAVLVRAIAVNRVGTQRNERHLRC